MAAARRRLLVLACITALTAACGGAAATAPRITRLQPSGDQRVAMAAAWQPAYGALLAEPARGAVMPTADPAAAAQAVRDGLARYALTVPGDAAGLEAREFDAVPAALLVPLTFPVEEISSAQARDAVAGRVRDWRALGGPPGPITLVAAQADSARAAVTRAIGERAAPIGTRTSTPSPQGALWVEPWTGPALDRKALRVDGALPDDPAYPLRDRRVVAGRSGEQAGVETLARRLRQGIAAQRPAEVVLDAVGDIMLGRSVGRMMAERGPDFPFALMQPLLAAADLRFGNLELPLTERGTPAAKDYVFRAPPAATAGLTSGGFNVLSLANNHALDYGAEGLLDTLAALDRAGIAHAGAGRTPEEAHAPAVLTIKGVRIAVLAYVNVPDDSRSGFSAAGTAAAPGRPGVAWGTVAAVRRDVQAAKRLADVVIVSMHSGYEYTATPNPVQRELAHAAIDAGASLVLGSHPHVLQGIELYRDAPIIYSLGNFVFDLDQDDRRQPGLPSLLTVVARITLTAQGVQGIRLLPAVIDARDARPVPVTGPAAQPVLERLYRLTEALR